MKSESKLLKAYYSYIGESHIIELSKEANNYGVFDESDYNQMDIWFNSFEKKHKKEQKRINLYLKIKSISRIAAIVILFISISFTFLFIGVEAFRVTILNSFIIETNTHTSIEKYNVDSLTESGVRLPNKKVGNLKIFTHDKIGSIYITRFVGSEEFFLDLSQSTKISSVQIDSEDARTEEILINEVEVLFVYKNDIITVYWSDGEWNFLIVTNTSKEIIMDFIKLMK